MLQRTRQDPSDKSPCRAPDGSGIWSAYSAHSQKPVEFGSGGVDKSVDDVAAAVGWVQMPITEVILSVWGIGYGGAETRTPDTADMSRML
jgi:hypothetical protein